MYLLLVIAAAVLYTIGGIYMKLSEGLSQFTPTLFIYLFYAAAATFQTLAMNKSDLGGTYIFVLGLESVMACLFGMSFFKETYSLLQFFGVFLIVAGMVFLRSN